MFRFSHHSLSVAEQAFSQAFGSHKRHSSELCRNVRFDQAVIGPVVARTFGLGVFPLKTSQ